MISIHSDFFQAKSFREVPLFSQQRWQQAFYLNEGEETGMSTVQNVNSHLSDLGSAPGCPTHLLDESQTNPALSLCVYVVAVEASR